MIIAEKETVQGRLSACAVFLAFLAETITWYSQCVASYQSDEYSELQTISPVVIKEIRDTAFVWNKSFIGYSNSEQVESYYNTLALLDAQQSIHWDMFPPDASFGTIKYGDIVQSIVDFSGYSMKHLNYAVMLYGIENNLYLENLVLNIMRESEHLRTECKAYLGLASIVCRQKDIL